MRGGVFFDTNLLVYAALQPDRRSERARTLLARGGTVSVQVLNEFANVARRELRRPWPEVTQALSDTRALCRPPLPIGLATHEAALGIAGRLGYACTTASSSRRRSKPAARRSTRKTCKAGRSSKAP